MAAGAFTVATSDLVNPRIDLVCATVVDVGSSASNGLIQILTGTPAAGATTANLNGAPTLPANSLLLCYLLIPANATSVVGSNISDQRVFTAASGGIVPVSSLSTVPLGYQGNYLHDRNTGRLCHNPQAGPTQPKLLPVAPQLALKTTNAGTLTNITVASVSVTTDGSTDLEIILKWPSVYINNSGAYGQYGAVMVPQIDGLGVAGVYAPAGTNATTPIGGGGTLHHVTSSGVDRPSNGTHTVSFVMFVYGDGTHQVAIPATALLPASLYVRAAPL